MSCTTAEMETEIKVEMETKAENKKGQTKKDMAKVSQLAKRIFCCWGAMNPSEYRAFVSVFLLRDPCLGSIQRVLEAVEDPSILFFCDALVGNIEERIKT